LKCIHKKEHARLHSNSPERKKMASENAIKNNARMQEAAKIWRSSEE
jgi:hypothetical protein